ncbi:MAG: hypothetical protein ACRDTV_02210, partial [Mycobacterium sp.]
MIQDHPNQQRERVRGQKLIGLGFLCQAEIHKHTQPQGPRTVKAPGFVITPMGRSGPFWPDVYDLVHSGD